jgi:enolase-phosphatase E1
VGGKRERTSYEKIALESGFKPSEIYFFSDINAELEAAFLAGFNCIQLKRYPVLEGEFQIITNFNEFIF